MRVGFLAIAAMALAAQAAEAALTCPFDIQSKVASTLTNPPMDSASGSTDSDDKTKKPSSGSTTSSSTGSRDVGSTDGTGTDAGSATAAPTTEPTTTEPSTTTSAPIATTKPGATTTTPTPQRETPAPTTVTPTTGSTTGVDGNAGRFRFLQATTPTTTAPDAGGSGGGDTTTTTAPATEAPTTSGSNGTPTTGSGSSNSSSSVIDSFTCDEAFYKQWETNGVTCGGVAIDVAAAVAAASCVIYSGTLGDIAGTTCVSMCAFPACTDNAWVYGAANGIASDIYKNVGIASFVPADVSAGVASRLTGAAVLVGNTTLVSSQQCVYGGSDDSFLACSCSALSSNVNKTDSQIKKQRETDQNNGVISQDSTSKVGSVLAPTTQSIAGVAVFVSAIAAVASSAVGGVSAASASVSAAGAGVGVWTIEVCQFGVMINQMQLGGKSAALSLFGKQMAPSAFTFLPFGKLETTATATKKSSSSKNRRLETADNTSADRGVAQYSRTLGIREDMLFLVTLAGVIVVMAGILVLFGIAYGIAGFFMSRDDFMTKFFDKMIGVQVLVAILSQYTIGVTGTYQIYYSNLHEGLSDPKCILAICSLVFLALGTILYGYIVVKMNEDEMKDVGTFTHINKKVCQRYGPFYDEYKFKNRFFFSAKMMLALVSGVATGYVSMSATYQISIILAAHVVFFFYLEVQSPHHSRFVQTTTSFVTIMKIATLALTFFLINATAGSNLPSGLQNGISLAIVGLNLFVLFLLMVRSLYAFWKKYQMGKDAKYDENDTETTAAQEYFKEETPPVKNNNNNNNGYGGKQSQNQNPYLLGGPNAQYEYSDNGDDMRIRSDTHLQASANQRGSYEESAGIRYDQISRNGAQHYIVNNPAPPQQPLRDQYPVNGSRDQVGQQQQQQYQQQQYQQQQYQPQQQQQYQQQQQQQLPYGREQALANQRGIQQQQQQPPQQRDQYVASTRDQVMYNQRRKDVIEL